MEENKKNVPTVDFKNQMFAKNSHSSKTICFLQTFSYVLFLRL